MTEKQFTNIGAIKGVGAFQAHLQEAGISIPCDHELLAGGASPLAQPLRAGELTIGNRFAIQPMEGWDGTPDGKPTELTFRRWKSFGRSGAKLIWGGEAVAVRHDGRANPNQLLINEANLAEIAGLRQILVDAHVERFGSADDLLIGLQLTHSGRFARPSEKGRPEPRIA